MTTMNSEAVVIRKRLQQSLEDALIIGNLCDRHYQGVINSIGDKLYLGVSCDDVAIKSYDPAVELDAPQELDGEDITLAIDHGAYFNIKIDDTVPREDLLTSAVKSAAAGLAKSADQHVLNVIRQDAGRKITTAVPDDGLYMLLLQVKMFMDDTGVPRQGRKLILPPYLDTALTLDERYVVSDAGNASTLLKNSCSRAMDFDIYVSDALEDEIIAIGPDSVGFAGSIADVIVNGDVVTGLYLSGAKVIKPEAVAVYSITG